MKKPAEPKLNAITTIEGKQYLAKQGTTCDPCALFNNCPGLKCSSVQREGGVKIILEEI